MALSDSTVHKLADVLTPEIIQFIYKDERWIEFMMEMIPEFLGNQFGEMDEELMVDLSQCIMERIILMKDSYKNLGFLYTKCSRRGG